MDDLFDKMREANEARETDRGWRDRLAAILTKVARCASETRPAICDENTHVDSLAVARGQLVELLRTENAELIGSPGETVDPSRHEIFELRDPETEVSLVLHVEREGLIWESEVVEKALVVASRTKRLNKREE